MTNEPEKITESVVEQTALAWFESLGYTVESGPAISPGEPGAERQDYDQVVLVGRLQTALENINPNIPPDATREAVRKIARADSPSLIENNRRFHRMLTDGVDVSYMQDGREVHDKVWLLDLEDLDLIGTLKERWIAAEAAKRLDYPIFMAVSERGGKNNSGDYEYRVDEDGHPQEGQFVVDQDLVNYDLTAADLANASKIPDETLDETLGVAEAFVRFAQEQGFDFWEVG
jgi:hypothetical protein